MTYDVDTLILGGGPAGAACAISLQKSGVSSLILEKRAFPRDKTCGGLMTQKTFDVLCRLVPEAETAEQLFCDRSDTLELYARDERLTRSALTKPLRSVRRAVFDNYLIERFRALGGTVLENETGYALDPQARQVTLRSGDAVRYRHLVAADGALSRTRALLGCPRPTLGFCVETFVDKSLLPAVDCVRISFGIVPVGYAWVIPSGAACCVGLGGVYDRDVDYIAALRWLLTSLGADADAVKIRGAFVPIDKPVSQKKTPENVLLIGDAGGFTDPLYGEGLYYALATGCAAAEVIASGAPDVKARFLKATAPMQRCITQGERLQSRFFRPSTLAQFLQRIKGKNGFVGFYCDNQLAVYNYEYAELWKMYFGYRNLKH